MSQQFFKNRQPEDFDGRNPCTGSSLANVFFHRAALDAISDCPGSRHLLPGAIQTDQSSKRRQFVQNDLALPGNSALSVAVGRRIVAGEMALDGRQFGEWEMEIPHIHGTFASVSGWRAGDNTEARCTKFGRPPLVAIGGPNNRSYWDPNEYWQGTFLYVPGHGDQQMLQRASGNQAAPGPVRDYPVVTARFWSIACLPQLKNGSGEGFLAVSPDGTKYYFDWMAKFDARRMNKSDPSERPALRASGAVDPQVVAGPPSGASAPHLGVYVLSRDDVWLLPSRVIDRFGNVVTYTYDPAKPRNLQRIDASDGRSITFSYARTEDGRYEVVDALTDGVSLRGRRGYNGCRGNWHCNQGPTNRP